jgi:hypothetical protein
VAAALEISEGNKPKNPADLPVLTGRTAGPEQRRGQVIMVVILTQVEEASSEKSAKNGMAV